MNLPLTGAPATSEIGWDRLPRGGDRRRATMGASLGRPSRCALPCGSRPPDETPGVKTPGGPVLEESDLGGPSKAEASRRGE